MPTDGDEPDAEDRATPVKLVILTDTGESVEARCDGCSHFDSSTGRYCMKRFIDDIPEGFFCAAFAPKEPA